jgi:hypothetical protein
MRIDEQDSVYSGYSRGSTAITSERVASAARDQAVAWEVIPRPPDKDTFQNALNAARKALKAVGS